MPSIAVRDRPGFRTAPDLVESIAEETQGNPFFIEEITTHLQDEGAIDDEGRWISDTPIGDYGIPEGVHEVVGRRLDHLSEDVVSVLEVAAVIGPIFSVDVAGAIAELDERAVDSVADSATNARMITEGDDADEFAFAHALLSQTLYDDLPTRRRMRIHRAVGEELERLGRFPLIIVDEVGYIPFDPDAASLFYQLVSSRYEQPSLIVSSNKTFSAWAEIFGDAVAVEALVDRLVHHSHILTLKGDSYRLKDKHDELATTNDNH